MPKFTLAGSIITLVLSVVLVVLAYIFIVPDKNAKSKNGFVRLLHSIFNFKSLLIEKIIKFFYIFSTIFFEVYGVILLFTVRETYTWSGVKMQWQGGWGLLIIVLSPIIIRLVYEIIMMAIILVNNVIAIRRKLYGETEEKKPNEPSTFAQNISNAMHKAADSIDAANNTESN